MELHQLRGFYEISRERSFTRAAGKLFLTQPAISLQIKALEEELGEILFERQRGLRLTSAGEVLYRHAQEVFWRLERVREEISGVRQVLQGRLAIATSDTICSYMLPSVLGTFRIKHPQVEIDIRNKISSEVGRLVLENEVDFGLATLPLKPRGLKAEVLWQRRDLLICPPGHPLAGRKWVRLATLSAYPMLGLERGSVSRRLLEQDFRAAGVEWPDGMNLGSIDVMKRLVAVGLGVAVVPQMAVRQEVAAGDLAAVEVRGLKTRPVGLVEHSGRSRSPAAEAFVGMLRSEALGQS
jgi:DNA-binding transcriptional LysR family regulator